MVKVFEIEFVKVALENAFNNKDYKMVSFYEPLKEISEIETYRELYKEIIDDLNNLEYKTIGVVATTNSPTITSVKKAFISPFEFSVSMRSKLKYRDEIISNTYEMIDKLKGRKIEMVQLTKNGEITEVVPMGVLWQENENLKDYDFIGITQDIETTIDDLIEKGIFLDETKAYNIFFINEITKKLYLDKLIYNSQDSLWLESVIKSYDNDDYELFKLDLSFDSLKIDTPQTLNGEDFLNITFSGSSTLCSKNVVLGNDLVQVGIKEYKISNELVEDSEYEYLDPLDIPNDYKTDIFSYGLTSNGFKGSEHIESYSSNITYSFIIDESYDFIWNMYIESRYLTNSTPNITYKICEIYSSFGVIRKEEFLGKITNGVKVDKNDNDVMSVSIPFTIVGENE